MLGLSVRANGLFGVLDGFGFVAKAATGDGTEQNPYLVESWGELQSVINSAENSEDCYIALPEDPENPGQVDPDINGLPDVTAEDLEGYEFAVVGDSAESGINIVIFSVYSYVYQILKNKDKAAYQNICTADVMNLVKALYAYGEAF